MVNKYPQHMSVNTNYIWLCGDNYATLSMRPDEMDNLNPNDKAKLMGEVDRFIGKHGHVFVKTEDPDQNQIRFVCEKWKNANGGC